MSQAHVLWIHDGPPVHPAQSGWLVVDAQGRRHSFYRVGSHGMELERTMRAERAAHARARMVCDELNARGARREMRMREAGR